MHVRTACLIMAMIGSGRLPELPARFDAGDVSHEVTMAIEEHRDRLAEMFPTMQGICTDAKAGIIGIDVVATRG